MRRLGWVTAPVALSALLVSGCSEKPPACLGADGTSVSPISCCEKQSCDYMMQHAPESAKKEAEKKCGDVFLIGVAGEAIEDFSSTVGLEVRAVDDPTAAIVIDSILVSGGAALAFGLEPISSSIATGLATAHLAYSICLRIELDSAINDRCDPGTGIPKMTEECGYPISEIEDPVEEAITAGGAAGSVADSALGAAQSLESSGANAVGTETATSETALIAPNTEAAAAGAIGSAPSTPKAPTGVATGLAAPRAGGGRPGDSGAASGAGMAGFGTSGVGSAASDAGLASPSAADAGTESSAYSGGSGGAGGGSAGRMAFGYGSASGVEGSSGSQSFGESAEVPAMGSTDPEDYFTRINLEDSLFKIVERRYRAKTGSW